MFCDHFCMVSLVVAEPLLFVRAFWLLFEFKTNNSKSLLKFTKTVCSRIRFLREIKKWVFHRKMSRFCKKNHPHKVRQTGCKCGLFEKLFENMTFLEIARIVVFLVFFLVWGSFCSKKKLIAHRHTVQTVKINQTQLMEQTTLRRWKWSPLTICIDFSIHMSFFFFCVVSFYFDFIGWTVRTCWIIMSCFIFIQSISFAYYNININTHNRLIYVYSLLEVYFMLNILFIQEERKCRV